MKTVTLDEIKKLYVPPSGSHKGQNGRLLVIGGSHLFHVASLWALTVASRIVDLVHYSSVPENNELVQKAKEEFRNGIVVPRSEVESYIEEDDCILIGPGMIRDSETEELTNRLLKKYPQKQWVIDAGALQKLSVDHIPQGAILTPHHGEFASLWGKAFSSQPSAISEIKTDEDRVKWFAKQHQCIVLLKGQRDIVCDGRDAPTSGVKKSPTPGVKEEGACRIIQGGNAGMTKGGTGDVLAGLIAALACKNDPVLATISGSFINKRAGDALFQTVGPYFNATDLANQIPLTMKALL